MSVTREVAFPQSVSKQDKTESRSERPQDRQFVNFIFKTKLESEGRDPVQTLASRGGSADTAVPGQDGHTVSHTFPTHPG